MANIVPSNSSALQADLGNDLDTLYDLLTREGMEIKGFRKLSSRINIIPAGWARSAALMNLSHAVRWHPALAEYGASAGPLHDLYLVTTPPSLLPASFKHWSLYCQGRFFHLVLRGGLPKLQINALPLEEVMSEVDSIRLDVRCDNVHRMNAHTGNRRMPMIAFNIGQTQFNVSQIECLAIEIQGKFEEYTRHAKNCQLFVLSLANRVMMTKGVGTIFVGTKAQIVHWDLTATIGTQSSPFSQEEGFLLRAPNNGKSQLLVYRYIDADNLRQLELSNRASRHFQNFPALCADLQHLRNARAIRRLYLYGPYAVGSFDPHGRHTMRLVSASTATRLRQIAPDVSRSMKEFLEDIADGRFSRAVRGRRESNIRSYEKCVIWARKGDRIAQFLLPFHRWVMFISEEEAREVHIALGNRETGVYYSEEDVGSSGNVPAR
jgi:hypothetical protein